MSNKQGMKGAAKLFRAQLLVMLIASLIALAISGYRASISVSLGGLISAIPNAYFARMLFRYNGAKASQKIVKSFYLGEAIKMLLTISLFAVTFKYLDVAPLAFIVGFIVVQMMFWFAPFIFDNKRK